MDILVKIILLLALTSCGGALTKMAQPLAPPKADALAGTFSLVEGGDLDLSKGQEKPVVLQFASDTCVVCASEVEEFKKNLGLTQSSKNVKIYSVLVGAILEDAQDWKERWQVPWTVGYDESAEIYKKYCSEGKVPCLVIWTPKDGVVLQRFGKVPFEEIVQLTGPWN